MKKLFYRSFIIIGLFSISLAACKKDNSSTDTQDLTSVEETAAADESFSDTFTDITTFSAESDIQFSSGENQVLSASGTGSIAASCVNVSVSPRGDVWPKTVTFDFGTGCTVDNITRKGKIIAVYTDRFKKPGAKVTVSFDGYYVNDTKFEGTTVIVNQGKNTAGNFTFLIEMSRAKTINSKGTFTLNSRKIIEWSKGENTILASDDVFSITGEANGTNTKGQDFTVKITKALVKKVACRFIVEGTVEHKSGDRPTRTLDYGKGDCDAKATVTVNGVSKEITLRK